MNCLRLGLLPAIVLFAAGCGGPASDAPTATSAAAVSAYDVDVVSEDGAVYARVFEDGRTDYAWQDTAGTWREGTVYALSDFGESLQVRAAVVAEAIATRLSASLWGEGEPVHWTAAACPRPRGAESDADEAANLTANFTTVCLTSAEPHLPGGAEPHKGDDEAEPHNDVEAEPHKPVTVLD